MTDNLLSAQEPIPVDTLEPEVQKPPETIIPASADTAGVVAAQKEPVQISQADKGGAGVIVDKRTGHEVLDRVSTIADSLTQAADEEEAEFIQGVEDGHNPDKPKS